MKAKRTIRLVLLLLSLTLVFAGCGGNSEQPVGNDSENGDDQSPKAALKFATYHDQNNSLLTGFWMFIDNMEASGNLELTYVGGPEAIPAFDQFTAVKNGVIDFAVVPTTYYTAQIPEIIGADASMLTPAEEREAGVYDLINEAHNKYGIQFIGKASAYIPYYLYVNKKIDPSNPSLKGMPIRVSPVNNSFFKELGASTQVMPASELYTSLERGVVDGYGWPAAGGSDLGFNEVTKYKIEPSFYQLADVVVFNLDSWNSLPQEIRDEIDQSMAKAENDMKDKFNTLMEKEAKAYQDAGVEVITLTPEAAQKFLDMAYEAKWAEAIEASPEFAKKYRDLITK